MLVAGALGFAKELIVVLKDCNVKDLVFFDDYTKEPHGCIFENYPVIRSVAECVEYFKRNKQFILGVGSVDVRTKMYLKMQDCGGELIGFVSPHSRIGSYNLIDFTTTVMTNVIIENDNRIGKGNLFHVGSFVSHDVTVGDFCEVSPYVKLLGHCVIGNFCSIGTGAIVLPKVRVSDRAIIGAGAVVTTDVEAGAIVAGVPAKKIR